MSTDEGSGHIELGTILVEIQQETGMMLFTYRENNPETNKWAFSWGLGDACVEVLEVHPEEGLDTASSVDGLEFPDISDNISGEPLGAIAWMARQWIEEKEVEG
jgi:hypothetical protein